MNKVKEFMKNNWDDVATLGIVAVTELTLILMYRGYLKKCEETL